MTRLRSTERSFFRFCPRCATPLERRRPDDRVRPVCPSCGWIQYRNPVVGVAAIIREEARILLGRRAAASSFPGSWCLPCGYVEYDEDLREALIREVEEETGLVVEVGELVAVHSNFHLPDSQSVGIWFHVRPIGGTLRPGDDIDELRFVDPAAPGVALAFPTDALVLADLAGR